MTQTDLPSAIDDLEVADADPKLAQAIAELAFRTECPAASGDWKRS